jgi:hypothetical protein
MSSRPVSSIRKYSDVLHAWQCHTWMEAFGASSPKGTVLWGFMPSITQMSRNLPEKAWTPNQEEETCRCSLKSIQSNPLIWPKWSLTSIHHIYTVYIYKYVCVCAYAIYQSMYLIQIRSFNPRLIYLCPQSTNSRCWSKCYNLCLPHCPTKSKMPVDHLS